MKIKHGFTLIELLIVIAVIGGLSSIAIFSFNGSQRSARDAKRQSDLKQYQTAVETFANRSNGLFPAVSGNQDLSAMCSTLGLSSCPDDTRTGENYNYNPLGGRTDYVMWVEMERRNSSGNIEFFVICSVGKTGKSTTEPNANCPL